MTAFLMPAMAVISRDFKSFMDTRWQFLLRVLLQPTLFVVGFAYIFPRVGQAIGGTEGSVLFASLLLPGTIVLSMYAQSLNGVSMPLIFDLRITGTTAERLRTNVTMAQTTIARLFLGVCESIVAGLLVLPSALFIPADPPSIDPSWIWLVPATMFVALVCSCIAFYVGTTAKANQIPLMFSLGLIPVTYLGASYYGLGRIDQVPFVRPFIMINPVSHMNELFRNVVTPDLAAWHWSIPFLYLTAISLAALHFGHRNIRKVLQQ